MLVVSRVSRRYVRQLKLAGNLARSSGSGGGGGGGVGGSGGGGRNGGRSGGGGSGGGGGGSSGNGGTGNNNGGGGGCSRGAGAAAAAEIVNGAAEEGAVLDGPLIGEWEETDRFSFDDSDRFEEDSLCSFSSEPESLCNNWRGWRRPGAAFGISKKPLEGE